MNCRTCKFVLSCTIATDEENIKCERYIKKAKPWSTGLPIFGKEVKNDKRK